MICVERLARRPSVYIFSDGLQESELLVFAAAVGLPAHWRRSEGAPEDRFIADLELARLALIHGARKVSRAEACEIWDRKRRLARRAAA
jgi:hypothetical protein